MKQRFYLRMGRPCRGFTILEILVGIVLLAIIGLLIVQIVTVTTRVTRMSNSGIDAAAQARLAFDRLGLDIAAMVNRPDIDLVAASSIGAATTNSLTFFSEVTSPGITASNNRGISLVSYQIGPSAESSNACLIRGATALGWTGSTSQGISGVQTNGLPVPLSSLPVSVSPSDFDILAPAVIRMVVGFQLRPTNSTVRLANGEAHTAQGQIVYSPPIQYDKANNPSTTIDRAAICSLIVGIVSLDPEQLKLLPPGKAPDQIASLASAFPTPASGQLPVEIWSAIAEQAGSLPSDIPLPVRQSVRVFQRAFAVNLSGTP